MKDKDIFSNFTNQYQLSKTLRFELVPLRETEKFIKEKGLLKQDKKRADDYKEAKKLIDEYHRDFIEKALSGKKLSNQQLKDYLNEFIKPERDNKVLGQISEALRKEIAGWLKDNPTKDGKKLIEEKVPEFLKEQGKNEEAKLVSCFKGFTTYFGGFNDNRENIYSDKEQSTAIAYRIVHENLPKFIANIRAFQNSKDYKIDFSEVQEQMKEQLDGNKLKDVFSLDYFNNCLTQSGIDRYNTILGGKTSFKGIKIQGVNEKINLFRQQNNLTGKQVSIMAPLYKQILSDRVSASYLPEIFESPDVCLNAIKAFYEKDIKAFASPVWGNKVKNVIDELETLFTKKLNAENDLSKIHIRNNFITAVSQQIFGSYPVIADALRSHFQKGKKQTKKLEDETNKYLKKSYFNISEIETALKVYLQETEIDNEEKRAEILKQKNPVLQYFNSLTSNIEIAKDKKEKTNVIKHFRQKHEDKSVQTVLNRKYKSNSELIQDKKAVGAIKDYLDSYLHILHFIKPLYVVPPKKENGEIPDKDNSFYAEFDELFRQLNSVIPLYNRVRSFLTQKPHSTEKIKLNFENKGNFLGGWVDSHTEDSDNATQSGGYLFRKKNPIGEYDYFLGISNDKKLFRSHLQNEVMDKSEYERLDYYQLKTASVYGNSYVGKNSYSKDKERLVEAILSFSKSQDESFVSELNKYLEKETPTPSGCFSLIREKFPDSFEKLIGYKEFLTANNEVVENLKETLGSLKRVPSAQKYASKNYVFFSEVITDIEKLAKEKSCSYFQVSQKELDEVLNRSEKPLLIFKITNKDLSYAEQFLKGKRKSRGNENLHTMYFKALLSGEQDGFDIGTGEVFFRKKSLNYNEKTLKQGHHIEKLKDKFNYPIISNRRFAFDKFQFHLSVILNYTKPDSKSNEFNDKVNRALKENSKVNVIGIDRGERHLVYYTIINQNGEIINDDKGNVLQGSFNEIKNEHNGKIYNTDYQDKLKRREEERDKARKSWDTIGKIKELKEGFLSQVVHKIAQLMIKHNAVVVLEDLNFGFKRGRMKVERQVYQKLEKMLIDKLNYLVFKDREAGEPGGVLNAYQLTAPFTSFKDMGKQTGFIFYVPAANTSKIDFATGFVNFLYPKYENEKQAKEFFGKMEDIRYNKARDYFEFDVDCNKFRTDKAEQLKKSRWTICTYGEERYHYQLSKREYNKVNVTEGMKGLLRKQGIEFDKGNDIRKAVIAVDNAQFLKDMIFYLKLTLQMRYTDGNDRDFILSSVADEKGVFFNSEKAADIEPKDADANGAYHIALKGLLQLQKIRVGEKKLAISNKEWHDFVQERAYRK
ncbi:MAG: type V CRISPR-associated protein Cpf1 [Planctomycetes bacterium]|nr:type V CRISPR-associated protein Cpf1 [Planctomycetota bacterium]MBM4065516.1 type V CRISPR-associated protein Cpf1 [Planctomycetota bacterium]